MKRITCCILVLLLALTGLAPAALAEEVQTRAAAILRSYKKTQ